MDKELEDAKKAITKGNNPVKETFKIGFMACIKSVEDKGNYDLAELLKIEHSQI